MGCNWYGGEDALGTSSMVCTDKDALGTPLPMNVVDVVGGGSGGGSGAATATGGGGTTAVGPRPRHSWDWDTSSTVDSSSSHAAQSS